MGIEAVTSGTVLSEFAHFVKIHACLVESAPREEGTFLGRVKVLARIVLAERKIFALHLPFT